jgi:NAD(P)H-hydrate epimerase
METITIDDVRKLILPARGSHKGQNGRLLVIGGSHLFHAASLWALTVASRVVDLVHYSSVPENNAIVHEEKKEFRNGIVVAREEIDSYIREDDCILIGPGMTRDTETETITNELFQKYPDKQWVIDAGSLQMMDIQLIPRHAILTPHHGEFAQLWEKFGGQDTSDEEKVRMFAQKFGCIVLLKGDKDVASDGTQTRMIEGGNPGMTKGGTGDVLAGLIAALACKNDPVLATIAGSFINKKAGDELFTKVGPFFNATDLANQIPVTMKELLLIN